MAKIKITVEDDPKGGVKITADPTFETIAKMITSGEDVADSYGYAVAMMNRAREVSKTASGENRILIPKVHRI